MKRDGYQIIHRCLTEKETTKSDIGRAAAGGAVGGAYLGGAAAIQIRSAKWNRDSPKAIQQLYDRVLKKTGDPREAKIAITHPQFKKAMIKYRRKYIRKGTTKGMIIGATALASLYSIAASIVRYRQQKKKEKK